MSDKLCPLCGKPIENEQIFCNDCIESAEHRTSNSLLSIIDSSEEHIKEADKKQNIEEEITNEEEHIEKEEESNASSLPKKRSLKKTTIFYFVACGIVVVLGLSSTFWVRHYQKTVKETEKAFWQECVKKNTPLDYSKYIVRFPKGLYITEAEEKIKEFRELEKNEWENALKTNTFDVYYGYISQYPQTPYLQTAKEKMDSISWDAATKSNNKDAYQSYIDNTELGNISGYYLNQAEEKLDYLKSLITIDGKELEKVKEIISNFFVAVSSLKTYDIAFNSTPEISPFLGYTSANPGTLVSLIKKEQDERKIKKIEYKPILNDIAVVKDSNQIYITEIPLLLHIIYNDKKKAEASETIQTRIELNSEKKVKSIYLITKQES